MKTHFENSCIALLSSMILTLMIPLVGSDPIGPAAGMQLYFLIFIA